MRYGIYVPNFGAFADPRTLAQLAREAEEAGWEGFFLWDHLLTAEPVPFVDPWVALAAMAAGTERIRLGPLVTPLPRRRPWTLAREAVTLDHLSGGRLVLGAGIGGDWWREYSAFGEAGEDALHGAMLDEGLAVLVGLWSGEVFSYEGRHYRIRDVQYLPRPVQRPRIPVWLAGMWPNRRPFVRAARWDGVFPIGKGGGVSPDDVRAMLRLIRAERASQDPFDVVVRGHAAGRDRDAAAALLADYADAGATWWLESFGPRTGVEELRAGVRQGPPGAA
jgi:alkanesulfonate monooxygenase SsuD/methylene tetrahydromethanopterin reductase-like flavin-dependent oxidoreductase (luciferase family)